MKKIKYALFIILILVFSTNKIYAETDIECFYIGDGFEVRYYPEKNLAYIGRINNTPANEDKEAMLNYCPRSAWANTTQAGYTFPDYLSSCSEKMNRCPEYLVIEAKDKRSNVKCSPEGYRVWGTDDPDIAKKAAEDIDKRAGCIGKYASARNQQGDLINAEEYYESFIKPELKGEDAKVTCSTLFGDITDDGSKNDTGTPTLGYMVNKVMQYIRIIVPVLIILLGTIDLAKAALASKEDQMKKAQTDFIKRLLLGVVIFFAPVIVRLVMHLADLVWTGVHDAPCNLP